MEVILLERIPKLGQIGDVVRVRPGYARNWLLPNQKALRSTRANREQFELRKAGLEARDLERRSEADQAADRIRGQVFVLVRQAGENGQLYGSVSIRDVALVLAENGIRVSHDQILLNVPLKMLGLFDIPIRLHPQVTVPIRCNIARNEEEAARRLEEEEAAAARAAAAQAAASLEPEVPARADPGPEPDAGTDDPVQPQAAPPEEPSTGSDAESDTGPDTGVGAAEPASPDDGASDPQA